MLETNFLIISTLKKEGLNRSPMRCNARYIIMLLLGVLMMSSCSIFRSTNKNRPTKERQEMTVQEYEEKLYGKETEVEEDLTEKSPQNDTIGIVDGEHIIMPDAVDVSDYIPAFMRKEKMEAANATLTISREEQLRNDMVLYGKQFLGLHYKYGGKKPNTGFDCSGLTRYVYAHFDIPIGASSRHQAEDGQKIPLNKTQAGDLVIFGKQGKIHHVAMVVSNDEKGVFVLHSTSSGVVIDNILKSKYWKPRIMYARKILGN